MFFVIAYLRQKNESEQNPEETLYWSGPLNIMILLRDDFRIGLVISPRVAVLAWGEAEGQYICPRTNN